MILKKKINNLFFMQSKKEKKEEFKLAKEVIERDEYRWLENLSYSNKSLDLIKFCEENGCYETLIQIIKNQKAPEEIRRMAKESLKGTVKNFIKEAFSKENYFDLVKLTRNQHIDKETREDLIKRLEAMMKKVIKSAVEKGDYQLLFEIARNPFFSTEKRKMAIENANEAALKRIEHCSKKEGEIIENELYLIAKDKFFEFHVRKKALFEYIKKVANKKEKEKLKKVISDNSLLLSGRLYALIKMLTC
jgi:hypothetical protein